MNGHRDSRKQKIWNLGSAHPLAMQVAQNQNVQMNQKTKKLYLYCRILVEPSGAAVLTDSGKRDNVEVWRSPKLFPTEPGDYHLFRKNIRNRVAKCQFFYTEQHLQTKFYPMKSAEIATIFTLRLNKTKTLLLENKYWQFCQITDWSILNLIGLVGAVGD